MAEFDWVTARNECSLVAIFEKLKLQLLEDVERRKSQLGDRAYYGFKVITAGNDRVAVVVEGNSIHSSVSFFLVNGAIEVRDKDGNVRIKATPTLSDDGQCRLRIGDQDRELWHLRKIALEDLLFGSY
jgi:hypothetical protein